jgi:hypothetical protein
VKVQVASVANGRQVVQSTGIVARHISVTPTLSVADSVTGTVTTRLAVGIATAPVGRTYSARTTPLVVMPRDTFPAASTAHTRHA